MNLSKFGVLAALVFLPGLASAQAVVSDGFQKANLVYPGLSQTRTLSNGDIITYDGLTVDRYDSLGVLIQNLTTFSPAVFTGAFVIDPTENFAIVGESSFGDVFRVDLTTGGKVFLANVFFNFDADFGPGGQVFISAALMGFGAGNDLLRLDPVTGTTTLLAHVNGPSGPVEFDNFGNLFYGTIGSGFPTPPGSTDVIIFLAASLAGADCGVPNGCLDETDAILFASGFDGATDLALEPQTGLLYLAENNFGTGSSRIWSVTGGAGGSAVPLVTEKLFNWTSGLEGFAGTTPATLKAYQPSSDARLYYNTTDFSFSSERVSVTTKRSTLGISGPGLQGVGQVDLAVTDAEPGGGVLFFFGPTNLVMGSEVAYNVGAAAPIFTALDPATLMVFGGMLPVDGQGAAVLSFNNPGGLQGTVSGQGLLFDLSLGVMLGSTNLVNF